MRSKKLRKKPVPSRRAEFYAIRKHVRKFDVGNEYLNYELDKSDLEWFAKLRELVSG